MKYVVPVASIMTAVALLAVSPVTAQTRRTPAAPAPSKETTCRSTGELYARQAAEMDASLKKMVAEGTPSTDPVPKMLARQAKKAQAAAEPLLARYGSAPKSQAEIDRLYKLTGAEVDAVAADCLK